LILPLRDDQAKECGPCNGGGAQIALIDNAVLDKIEETSYEKKLDKGEKKR
jgi:hypothetical protein